MLTISGDPGGEESIIYYSTSTIVQRPAANPMGIRDLGAPCVLFLLMGDRINDPFFGYGHFNKIMQKTVERLAGARGESSSLWGNYAMDGGVLWGFCRVLEFFHVL